MSGHILLPCLIIGLIANIAMCEVNTKPDNLLNSALFKSVRARRSLPYRSLISKLIQEGYLENNGPTANGSRGKNYGLTPKGQALLTNLIHEFQANQQYGSDDANGNNKVIRMSDNFYDDYSNEYTNTNVPKRAFHPWKG